MEPKELRIPLNIENMCEAEDAAWVLNYQLINKCEEFVRQLVRNWFSRFTEGTDEEHPRMILLCPLQNGHGNACDLDPLEIPWINGIYQVPGEGTIWLIWEDGRETNIDELPTSEQMDILYH